MEIVSLVAPPTRSTSPRPPLGLMYISSCLTKESINNQIIDIKGNHDTLEQIYNIIGDSDIVGITCLVTEIEVVDKMCAEIKTMNPKVTIVLGGPQPTTHPEHFSPKNIDYFVIGEGEITFPELVRAIRSNKDIREVKGIAWWEEDAVRYSEPRGLVENLDELPLPAYEKVDMDYYTAPTSWGIRPIPISLFWVFSSRGCPFKCSYCVAHEVFGKRIRQRSTENVMGEINHLREKYKVDGVYFYDESFTFGNKRTTELCEEIKKLKIVFGCQTRADLLTEETIKAMSEAGCLQIDFGIESGSEEMLKAIKKGVGVEKIKKALRLCRKYGIRIFANMMVNLPGETEEDLRKSLDLMKEIPCNVVIWNVTVPYPGGFLSKKLTREDYHKLMNFPSDEGYNLLEEKYRFSKHSHDLRELVDTLYQTFPHPRYIKQARFNMDYIRRCFLFVDFIFNPKYWRMFLRSERKLQYFIKPLFQPKHN